MWAQVLEAQERELRGKYELLTQLRRFNEQGFSIGGPYTLQTPFAELQWQVHRLRQDRTRAQMNKFVDGLAGLAKLFIANGYGELHRRP